MAMNVNSGSMVTLSGVDAALAEALAEAEFDRRIWAVEDRVRLIVTSTPPKSGVELLDLGNGVRLYQQAIKSRPQPWLDAAGQAVQVKVNLDAAQQKQLDAFMKAYGVAPVAFKKAKTLYVTESIRRELLGAYGSKLVGPEGDRGSLVRLGELGFSTGASFPWTLRGEARDSARNDGTYMVQAGLGIEQSRALCGVKLHKGTARGPLSINGDVEPEWFARNGVLGAEFEAGDTIMVHTINHNRSYRAGLDAQTVAFSAEDPAAVEAAEAEVMKLRDALDYMSGEDRAKARFLSPALLMPEVSLSRLIKARSWKGAKGLYLLFDERVELGYMALSRAVRTPKGAKRGDTLHVHRHPALPVGALVPMQWDGKDVTIVGHEHLQFCVLNPNDLVAGLLGADSDGDRVNVGFQAPFAYIPVQGVETYKSVGKRPLLTNAARRPDIGLTISHMQSEGDPRIGAAVFVARRLQEVGLLNDELRVLLGIIVQSFVAHLKRPMDIPRCQRELAALRDLLPEGVFMVDLIADVLRNGPEAFRKLDLDGYFGAIEAPTPYQQALIERMKEVKRILQEADFFRAKKVGLPSGLLERAEALLAEEPNGSAQLKRAEALRREIAQLYEAKSLVAGDEDAVKEISRAVTALIGTIPQKVAAGELSWPAVVRGLSPQVVAGAIPVSWLVENADETRSGYCILRGDPEDGEYEPMQLQPASGDDGRFRWLTGMASVVRVQKQSGMKYFVEVVQRLQELPEMADGEGFADLID